MSRRPVLAALAALLLSAPVSAAVLRGPYIQGGSADFMFVKWRTDKPSVGKVCYSTDAKAPGDCRSEKEKTTEHEVRLDGLKPGTQYHYYIDSWSGPGQFFVTAPLTG